MYRKIWVLIVIGLLLWAGTTIARADGPDLGFSWNNHAEKFSFIFGNLIDNHQQTRLLKNGNLQGYIYVQFTGDEIDGIPVARRADCNNPELDCRVGWEVIGIPVDGATLLQKGPRLWKLPAEYLPDTPDEFPEFFHFHWVGTPKKPCGLVLNDEVYSGYLFKRTAMTTFYWLGGNDDKEAGRLVTPGLDLHSNLDGYWTGGGGHGGEEPGGETGGEEGCGGHDIGDEPGGETGGCSGDTGDTGGCGGHDSGEEPGGETGGCGGDTGCTGH